MPRYEFWTDAGDENDIVARNLEEAARKASKKISVRAWRDGAWGWVKGPGGQMKVPERYNPAKRQRRRNAAKAKQPSKRVGKALAAWLKRQNPAMRKARSVRVQRLKKGVIKIIPVK